MNKIGMHTANGDPVLLKRIAWDVRADGWMLCAKCCQHYINDRADTVELVYTFPLAWDTTVTGFAAVIGGKRLVARVLRKPAAESRYEKAAAEGDAPMMLEYSPMGLCSVSLANIKPGETVEIEIETAKLLEMNAGEVRIVIPTVIADRYSSNGSQGNLLPYQQVETSALAVYPLRAEIQLSGGLQAGSIATPGRMSRITSTEFETLILMEGGYASSDIVVSIQNPRIGPAMLSAVFAGKGYAALCFAPEKEHQAQKKAVSIQVLLDCSGSMSGKPIEQAREALRLLAMSMTAEDRLGLTRFGFSTSDVISLPARVTERFRRLSWAIALESADADLGGTELAYAVEHVAGKISQRKTPADILLITDGAIWDTEAVVNAAAASGCCIFVLGVGAAPGETMLRQIADRTSGGCATVMPFEPMKDALDGLVSMMRSDPVRQEVSWQPDALWTSSEPVSGFAGRTQHCAAMADGEVKIPALTIGGKPAAIRRAEADAAVLMKLVAERRVRDLCARNQEDAACEIAEEAGILCEQTSMFLVAERESDEKAAGLAHFVSVPQMVTSSAQPMMTDAQQIQSAPDITIVRFMERPDYDSDYDSDYEYNSLEEGWNWNDRDDYLNGDWAKVLFKFASGEDDNPLLEYEIAERWLDELNLQSNRDLECREYLAVFVLWLIDQINAGTAGRISINSETIADAEKNAVRVLLNVPDEIQDAARSKLNAKKNKILENYLCSTDLP